MRLINVILIAVSIVIAAAAQEQTSQPNGMIYGTVLQRDGRPAPHIGVTASPLGVALGTMLPHTKTDDMGQYRFEKLPWWGKYTVYASDEEAGYSSFTTGPFTDIPEVEVTPEHREAELDFTLPHKAGFLRIHLTNAKTGAVLPAMRVVVNSMEKPEQLVFSTSCYSNKTILIPPDKNLLLHVMADGYREWSETAGRGKPLFMESGTQLTLEVELEPSK